MSEKNLNRLVLEQLKGRHSFRIENLACPGTPDIGYVNGFVECKWLAKWPKNGVARFRHWTAQQACWHKEHWAAGGQSWIVAQVADEYFLVPGHWFDGVVVRGTGRKHLSEWSI
jgi:hypothetical protein